MRPARPGPERWLEQQMVRNHQNEPPNENATASQAKTIAPVPRCALTPIDPVLWFHAATRMPKTAVSEADAATIKSDEIYGTHSPSLAMCIARSLIFG